MGADLLTFHPFSFSPPASSQPGITMTSAVCRPSQAVDVNSFSRHSNNAGSPLPFIPRRRSSMPSSQAIFPFPPPDPVTPSTTKNFSSRAPDEPDSRFEPSESHPVGKVRTQDKIRPLQPLQPVEHLHISTFEFPRKSPALTSSSSAQIFPFPQSLPHLAPNQPALTTDTAVILNPSPSFDGHVRKKSGEPLKSSLKCRTPTRRPSLTIVTGIASSKSEPASPTHARSKSVSFAPRLDQVKLYIPTQKPIAVSRDGSPAEDTSGTESEAPVIVRRISPDEKQRLLVMEVVNAPHWWTMDVDVMLESIILSKEATICGHVKVRNIAFEKSVAVRFTFDFWQTTSEVTAKYEQPLAHGTFDRFSFVIRIHDILPRIEYKTLFMAIRYVVGGQELWDNNFGHNYKITFSLPLIPRPQGTIAQIQYATDEEAVATLTRKLERVQPMETLLNSQRRHQRQKSGSPSKLFYDPSATLSSRYTWDKSLQESRQPVDHSAASHPKRTNQSTTTGGFPWFQEHNHSSPIDKRQRPVGSHFPHTRGSPRLGDDTEIAVRNPSPSGLLHEGGPTRHGFFRNHRRDNPDVQSHNGLVDTGSPGAKTSETVFDYVPPQDKVKGTMPSEIERISSDDPSTASSSQPSPLTVIASDPPSNHMTSIISR